MKSPVKPLSLADVHSVYASSPVLKPTARRAEAASTPPAPASYTRSDHFKRDPGHSGMQPDKPDPSGKGARSRSR